MLRTIQRVGSNPGGGVPRLPRVRVLPGFLNVWRKELTEWMRTGRFAVATGLTSLMLGIAPVAWWLYKGGLHEGQLSGGYQALLITWVALSLTLGSYLVAALTMGILLREEDSGTAHWLLSKPISRVGYVLAKYSATSMLIVVGAVIIPSAVFFGVVEVIHAGGVPDWGAAALGVSFVALNAVIVVGLVVGLSALFSSAAAVAGVAIGLNFIPIFLRSMVDSWLVGFFPITMGETALRAAQGQSPHPWLPVVSGIVLAVVAVAFACIRVSRRQFR